MPELPEVETIRRSLERTIVGKEIVGLELRRPSLLQGVSREELGKRVLGNKVIGVRRRAKYLIFDLNNGFSLIIHLGLEGLLFLDERHVENPQLVLRFSDGVKLHLDDIKDYSRLFLVPTAEVERLPSLAKLGIEPFTEDYTWENFSKLMRSHQEIKRLLLDQNKIAGLGNIYANEVLYACGVHPQRPASELSLHETRCLFDEIQRILQEAIERRGTSVYHYRDIDGSKGEFQDFLKVYGKAGQPCERCGTLIKEINQGGRPSYFCPKCQPLAAIPEAAPGEMEDLFSDV